MLGTSVLGTSGLTSATTSALGGLGAGVYGPATASQVGLGATTIGAGLGAAGGGFALGSLAGMGTQALTGKTGPGPEIGAAAGTAAGMAAFELAVGAGLAPETFGLSLLASALIGGAVGRSGGGLIGRKKAA
jgi:hypothetical protein